MISDIEITGAEVADWAERHLVDQAGEPLQLTDWQRDFLERIYDPPYPRHIVAVARS